MGSDDRTNDSQDNEELPDLPDRQMADAEQVKGGAIPQPSGPVPIPYPNRVGAIRVVDPCV